MRGMRRLGLVVALAAMALGVVVPAWQLARSGPVGGPPAGPARAVGAALLPGVGGARRAESGPVAGSRPVGQPSAAPAQLAAARASFAKLPLHFEPNQGQMDESVDFMSKGAGHTVYLTPAEAVIALHSKDNPTALQLKLRGANESTESFVTNKLPGHTSYFIGNQPERWHTGIPQYGRAGYRAVYPGIDLVYYGNESGRLEHDFIVAPGADPSQIVMEIDGAESLRLDRNGDLVMQTAAGEVRLQRPVVYQPGTAGREPVAAKYRMRGRTVRFALGEYDPTRELVIDPVVVYSSYFGWYSYQCLMDVQLDGAGNIYLFGVTSTGEGPPLTFLDYSADFDYFVAKLDPTARTLLYFTYLGSSSLETFSDDQPRGAIDAQGQAYLVGATTGPDYPTTMNAYQGSWSTSTDGVVSQLNSDGDGLLYSTYLGGDRSDHLTAIALDSSGAAYVTGHASDGFPNKGTGTHHTGGGRDVVVAKLDVGQTGDDSLVWSTFFGGADDDRGYGIALGSRGLFVCGQAQSTGLQTSGAAQGINQGGQDGIIAQFDPDTGARRATTYLGGGANDAVNRVALTPSGQVLVTGVTQSGDFPTVGQTAQTHAGSYDAFVALLPDDLSSVTFATCLGGTDREYGYAVLADDRQTVWVAGSSYSGDFPRQVTGDQPAGGKGFLARYDLGGNRLFSDRLGDVESLNGLALMPQGRVIAVGLLQNPALPPPANGYQTSSGGGTDGLILMLDLVPPAFTSADAVAFTAGHPGTFTVTTSGDALMSITVASGTLPAGVTFTDNGDGTATLAGTPTESDTSDLTFQASNGASPDATQTFTLTVNPPVAIEPANLLSWTQGQPDYPGTVEAAGGTAPFEWTITHGALPTGLTLGTASGAIEGTPTESGTFGFEVQLLEAYGTQATRDFSLTIHDAPTLTTDSLPDWTVNQPGYGQAVAIEHGTAPFTWTIRDGTLPDGLTLEAATGVIEGTPTEAGDFSFTLKATDAAGAEATAEFTVTIYEAIAITLATLPDWTVAQPGYSQTVTASGGTGALTLVLTDGVLPPGLTFAPDTGVIEGTPTAAGTFGFTLQAEDTVGATGTQAYTVTIHEALAITTDGLPGWTKDLADYRQTLAATGGTGALNWTVSAGALPDGLTLGAANGVIEGTPTAAGAFAFTIQAEDTVGAMTTQAYTVTISHAITIMTSALSDWTKDLAGYSQTLTATGGTGALNWTVSAGALPDGLALDGAGGLSGTPTAAGAFNFTVAAADTVGASATQAYTVEIHDAITITTSALADWTKGLAGYSQTVTATGGTGALVLALADGALPPGLMFHADDGTIDGTPTAAGTFTFTVTATDTLGATGSRDYTVTIHDGLAVTTATLADGVAHQPGYSQTLTSVGGAVPVSWTVIAGTLPAGLSLNGTTGEINGEPTTVGVSTFTVRATDAAGATADRELTLTITPNAADDGRSTATVPNGTAGAITTITVTARDAQGNLRAAGGDIVVVTITGANSATATAIDNGDGTYTATYIPTVAGTDQVAITIGGDALAASPFTSQVSPGATDAAQSTATVPDGTAGAVTTITVTARDAQGNLRTAGGDIVVVTITGANSATAAVLDNGDGTYTATYTPTEAGTDTVAITINDAALAASPYTSQVAPGAVSGEQSQVIADRDHLVADGHEAVTLTITLRDAQGNPIAGVAPEDLVAVADPSDGVTFGPWSGPTDAAGQATITATRTVAGEVNFTITASAQQLVDAPHVAFRPVLTVTFPAGLHLLGLPGTPDDPSPTSVLGDPATGWKQARWDPATQVFAYYDQQPDADLFRFGPGRGQWVRLPTPATLTLAGEATPDGPFTLPVPEGWSNGANPFGVALPWTLDAIRVRLGGAEVGNLADAALWDKVRPYLWIYDSANQTNRLIFPGLGDDTVPAQAGFWAKALVDGAELVLSPPTSGRSRARSASTARDWLATLLASGTDGLATSVTVGTSSRLAQPLAVERPPANGAAPAVEVSVIATNGSRLAGELLPAAGTFTWDLAVTSRQAGEVNLRWPSLLRDLPAGLILELADQQTGQTVLLNTRAAYRFAAIRADETRRLRLTARFGSIDRATITNLSAQPNRAGGTTLQLTLSAPAEVRLTVRGLGGRLVREISQQAAAGTVALTWDGLDADGRRVPRGTYQVEATAVSANGAVHRAVRVVTVR